jgi:hypothetical protein
MSVPVNLALTTAGINLNAKIEQGDGTIPLDITRIIACAGQSDDPLNLAAPPDLRQEFTIQSRRASGGLATIDVRLTNDGLTTGYSMWIVCIMATDPDVGEIVYRVLQFASARYIPSMTESPLFDYTPQFNFETGNASEVNVTIDNTNSATIAQLDEVREIALEALEAAQGGSIAGGIFLSATEPTEPWVLWNEDGGDIDTPWYAANPNVPPQEDSLILDTTAYDPDAAYSTESLDGGENETLTNFTEDEQTTSDSDVIASQIN